MINKKLPFIGSFFFIVSILNEDDYYIAIAVI